MSDLFASIEAERTVLGAVLVDNSAMHDLAAPLQPRHFSDNRHVLVWEHMLSLYERSQPIDLVTLRNDLADRLDEAGGVAYVAGLLEGVPRITNAPEWSRIVIEKARRRYARAFATRFMAEAENPEIETEELIERFQEQLARLQASRRDGAVAIGEVVPKSIAWLEKFATSTNAM